MPGYWSLPSFVSESHFTGLAINTGFNISTPTGVQIGDYMLMFLVTNKDTITPDAKFTLIRQDLDSANPWSMALYSRIVTSADVAGDTYTWACSPVTNAPNTAVILAYRGVNATNVVISKLYTAGTTNPVTTPSVTNTTPALIVRGNGTRYGATTSTVQTFTGSGNERFDGGNAGAVSYEQAYYDSGSATTTVGAQAGISITVSSTTLLADRLSYSVALGAQWHPTTFLNQSVNRAASY